MSTPTVFITGASSGIGLGLAKEYLSRGAAVYAVSRRDPKELGEDLGDQFHFCAMDLTDERCVANELQPFLSSAGEIDVAVLNAGVLGEINDLRDVPLSELRRTMDINLWANKSVIDILMELGVPVRQIVTISSGAAVNGNRGWNGYSLSKAALNMLTQLYARECAGTHFSAVAPGLVDTAMQDHLCGLPDDDRFLSLEVLKSKRNTEEMPEPNQIAPRLIDLFAALRESVQSGEFVDIRTVSMEQFCDARR